MSLTTISFIGLLILVIGYLLGHGASRLSLIPKFEKMKIIVEEAMTKLRQDLTGDAQRHAVQLSDLLKELASQYGPDHPINKMKDDFAEELLVVFGPKDDLRTVSNVGNEAFPRLWLAIGQAIGIRTGTESEAQKHRETNLMIIDLLIQMTGHYWEMNL